MIDDKEVKKPNAIEGKEQAPKVEDELSESDIERVAGGVCSADPPGKCSFTDSLRVD